MWSQLKSLKSRSATFHVKLKVDHPRTRVSTPSCKIMHILQVPQSDNAFICHFTYFLDLLFLFITSSLCWAADTISADEDPLLYRRSSHFWPTGIAKRHQCWNSLSMSSLFLSSLSNTSSACCCIGGAPFSHQRSLPHVTTNIPSVDPYLVSNVCLPPRLQLRLDHT